MPDLWRSVAAPPLSFAVAYALLRFLLIPATRRWFLDHPNARSLHDTPTPRTGGLAVVPGCTAGMLLAGGPTLVAALATAVMAISLLDDWKHLPAGVRLLAHLAVASLFVVISFPAAGWPATVAMILGVGWMTNLYNFMDGADGLAGGMALFGFSAYALAAWMGGQPDFAAANLCVAAAAAAFLLFNFPPARIFMGDAGSIPLGFLSAALGLTGWQAQLWPLWFPLVVFGPFIVDASLTLVRRALHREKIWQAHRSHYYQRLVLTGWSHRRLALAEYALMAVCALGAVAALHAEWLRIGLLGALAAVYVCAIAAVDLRWVKKRARA